MGVLYPQIFFAILGRNSFSEKSPNCRTKFIKISLYFFLFRINVLPIRNGCFSKKKQHYSSADFKTIRVPLQTLPYRSLSLGFVVQRVEAVFAVTLSGTVLTSCETLAVQLQTLRFRAITRFFAV